MKLFRPKQCPNCNEPNKPESKFCSKCNMVLTYNAYNETVAEERIKEAQFEAMMRKQEQFEQVLQTLIDSGQLKPKNMIG